MEKRKSYDSEVIDTQHYYEERPQPRPIFFAATIQTFQQLN